MILRFVWEWPTMKIAFIWNVIPSNLVEVYQNFKQTYYFNHFPMRPFYTYIRLHGITFHIVSFFKEEIKEQIKQEINGSE